ncbi:hypothetical protein Tco_1263472 [Tanacetum coccineum]
MPTWERRWWRYDTAVDETSMPLGLSLPHQLRVCVCFFGLDEEDEEDGERVKEKVAKKGMVLASLVGNYYEGYKEREAWRDGMAKPHAFTSHGVFKA